jgi:hypothetical protein
MNILIYNIINNKFELLILNYLVDKKKKKLL